jgi:hypothetical protein
MSHCSIAYGLHYVLHVPVHVQSPPVVNAAVSSWKAGNRMTSAVYNMLTTRIPPSSVSFHHKAPLAKHGCIARVLMHDSITLACYMYEPDSVTVLYCHAVLPPYILHHMLTPPQCHITAGRAAANRKCL